MAAAVTPEEFEARRVDSGLTRTEFVLRGGRFHLFLLSRGAGLLEAEDGPHRLAERSLCWLPNGTPRRLGLEAGSRGLLLSIPDVMLGRSIPDDIVGSQMRQAIGLKHCLQHLEADAFAAIESRAGQIEQELFDRRPGAEMVLQNLVSILAVDLWRQSGAQTIEAVPVPRTLVHGFLSLLDVHLRDHWSVARYAEHLGTTRDRLTSVLRRATGETPLALIHRKMIAEAKTLLTSSNQQVAEVAFTLGYNDPAYFNRFFQRHVGETPARYRRDARRQRDGDESFAAWP